MGGVCSGGNVKRSRNTIDVEHEETSSGFSGKLKSVEINYGNGRHGDGDDDDDIGDGGSTGYGDERLEKRPHHLYGSSVLHLSISRELKPSTAARNLGSKTPQVTSFLGKAGMASLEKAVEVLDILGSSITNLNSDGFSTGVTCRGNKISILAFEVANTIAKGSNLLQSLSEENIKVLEKHVLNSEAVKSLVSTDMNELLGIAAADKREEFDVFSREVIRFGNLCKDPQWHNLDRFFAKLDSDTDVHQQPREEAEMTMQELTTLAQYTSELHSLDRLEQDYQRKLGEADSLHLPHGGELLSMFQTELKHQRKIVRNMQKKSLWSQNLEQIVEKLIDIITFIRQEIMVVFGVNAGKANSKNPETLGASGLALHYAIIIIQIDSIASRPTSLPPNMRDTLYNGLPPAVKTALRSRLQLVDSKEELTVPQIKAEMKNSLQWLVVVATDTAKAHQGFGWVGEWANTGSEFGNKTSTPNSLIRLQTLYHADKRKVESYILDLLTWLHRLVSLVSYRDNKFKTLHSRSPLSSKGISSNLTSETLSDKLKKTNRAGLSDENRNLLEDVTRTRKFIPRLSKSQEFAIAKDKNSKVWALSRSTGSSPRRMGINPRNVDVLDVLDGLDSTFLNSRLDD